MSCDSLLCGKGRFYMKKYENFCSALCNMKEIYKYDPPYDTVILTGLLGLFEVCFEQSWKMKRAFSLIEPKVGEYIDNFSASCLKTVRFSYGKRDYTALADSLFIGK